MSLKEKLTEEMKNAMRARDMDRLGVIRYLLSEIKNVEIDSGEQDDAGIQKIVSKLVKQMNDAINDYKTAGRDDLVSQEEAKVVVLEEFLPEQMSDEKLEEIVAKVLEENPGAQMGQIIGMSIKAASGQADGGRVSAMVKKLQSN